MEALNPMETIYTSGPGCHVRGAAWALRRVIDYLEASIMGDQ